MKKGLRAYAAATQFIASILGGALIGLFIARKNGMGSTYVAIYTGVGIVIGLFSGIVVIFQFIKVEQRIEKREKMERERKANEDQEE